MERITCDFYRRKGEKWITNAKVSQRCDFDKDRKVNPLNNTTVKISI